MFFADISVIAQNWAIFTDESRACKLSNFIIIINFTAVFILSWSKFGGSFIGSSLKRLLAILILLTHVITERNLVWALFTGIGADKSSLFLDQSYQIKVLWEIKQIGVLEGKEWSMKDDERVEI